MRGCAAIIALALARPDGLFRPGFVPMTLAVVLFSLLVQGLSLERVIGYLTRPPAEQRRR